MRIMLISGVWYYTNYNNYATFILGIEMFHQILDEAQAGDQLGALIRGTKRDDIRRGMVMCKPGSVSAQDQVKTQVK